MVLSLHTGQWGRIPTIPHTIGQWGGIPTFPNTVQVYWIWFEFYDPLATSDVSMYTGASSPYVQVSEAGFL